MAIANLWTDLVAHYNRDDSRYGTLTSVKVTLQVSVELFGSAQTNVEIVRRNTDNYLDNAVLATINVNAYAGLGLFEYGPYNLYITDWAELAITRVGVHSYSLNEGISSVAVGSVEWDVCYTPDEIATPDEQRIVYAEQVLADVTSLLGEDPTPALVIRDFLKNHSPVGDYVDETSFTARHNEYVLDGYYINGMMPGDYRLHDGIKQVLFEGMARLLFNQGVIKLLTYFTIDNSEVDKAIVLADIALRSRRFANQPVSEIKNTIYLRYGEVLAPGNVEYEGTETYINLNSVNKFTTQDIRSDYDLVHDAPVAQRIGYRTRELYSTPITIHYFTVFMPTGFVLEKGDKVTFPSFITDTETLTGNILSIKRVFGSGKNKQINTYEISVITIQGTDAIPPTRVLSGNWRYATISTPPASPPDGKIEQYNAILDNLTVSNIDTDLADRSADLALVSVGDIITDTTTSKTWTVTSVSNQGTHFDFGIDPAENQTGGGDPRLFTFDTPGSSGSDGAGYGLSGYGVNNYGE